MAGMLTLLALIALFGLGLTADDTSQTVSVKCPGGTYAGKVNVNITYTTEDDKNGKVLYSITGKEPQESFPNDPSNPDNDWCAIIAGAYDEDSQTFCSEPTIPTLNDVTVTVYVKVQIEGEGDSQKNTIQNTGTRIELTNVAGLTVSTTANSNVKLEIPDAKKTWNVISGIDIQYVQRFGGQSNGRFNAYCGSGIYRDYPGFEYYDFGDLSLTGLIVAEDAKISSNRAVGNLYYKNMTFYNSSLEIKLYPGIYQGECTSSIKYEEYGIKGKWEFNGNTSFLGNHEVVIEGNVPEITWESFDTGTNTFKTHVTERTHFDWNGQTVWCNCVSCTQESDVGHITTKHTITGVTLYQGSNIIIDGHVQEIETTNFNFGCGSSKTNNWQILDTHDGTPAVDNEIGYHVIKATYTGSTIDTVIAYNVSEFIATNTNFNGEVHSKSKTVNIKNGSFNSYVRHLVVTDLQIAGDSDTNKVHYGSEGAYYDHIIGKSYPTAKVENVSVGGQFVMSVNNKENPFALTNVDCSSKVDFMVRHTSRNMEVSNVTGCKLVFKNNADSINDGIYIGTDKNTFTYTYANDGNNNNWLRVLDNAAYHANTVINVSKSSETIDTRINTFQFMRVDIDSEAEFGSTDSDSLHKDRHPPEIDPYWSSRKAFGNSYPVNLNITNYYIENFDLTYGADILSNSVTGTYCNGNGDNASYFCQGKSLDYDITYREGPRMLNDDVNLLIDNSEVGEIKATVDSLVLSLLNSKVSNTTLEMADSSMISIKDSKFINLTASCAESLDLTMIHSIFDSDVEISSGDSSHIYLRSIMINNDTKIQDYSQYGDPKGFFISFEGGYAKLDHVQIGYGHLDVATMYGDITVVQAFAPWSSTKVSLLSNHGTIDVTHPKEYYRDLNSLVDFESVSGTAATLESGVSDIFAFEIGPSTTSFTMTTDHLWPYTKYVTSNFETEYGNVKWEYANNLEISSVHTVGKEADLHFKGYQSVYGGSSINAMSLETLFKFKFDSLDHSKTYFISVRDTTGVDEDLGDWKLTNYSVGDDGGDCVHNESKYDIFDSCVAYVILPTIDLIHENEPKGLTLTLIAAEVYFKDAASSYLNKLYVQESASVTFINGAVAETEINLNYNDLKYYNEFVKPAVPMDIYLSAFATDKLTIKADTSSGNYGVESHIALMENTKLGFIPSVAQITSAVTLFGTARTVIPVGSRGEDGIIACSDGTLSSGHPMYYSCTFSSNNKIEFLGAKEGSESKVDINFIAGENANSLAAVNLLITYARVSTMDYLKKSLTFKEHDRIIIDNHRFATDFASFNANYPSNTPSYNNVYIIPSSDKEKAGFFVTIDTNVDDMFYFNTTTVTGSVVHKFNMIEQSQMYLYIPKVDGLSIRTAGDNINLFLSDIGKYDNIYNTSYLVANVLKAEHVRTSFALIYSLEGAGNFLTEVGYVGIDAAKTNASIFIDFEEQYSAIEPSVSPRHSSYEKKLSPVVTLEKGTINDLGIFTRKYKYIMVCDDDEVCEEVPVLCSSDDCDITNYIWDENKKEFFVGKDYTKARNNSNIMNVKFTNLGIDRMMSRCKTSDGVSHSGSTCPNSPIYNTDVKDMSFISIRGKLSVGNSFANTASKNNRSVTENDFESALSDTMPTWALVLIILTAVVIVALLAMIVLRLFGCDAKFADCCGGDNAGAAGVMA